MILLLSLVILIAILIIYLLMKKLRCATPRHCLFQYGHASALFGGMTEGEMDFKTLASFGDFGLGTFNNINGELVTLNGEFFQIGQQGQTVLVDPSWQSPSAQLIFFSPTLQFDNNFIENYQQLKTIIDTKLINKNIPYAIRLTGHFKQLALRSRAPKSSTTNLQPIYNCQEISGTLVGYWFPTYLLNIGVPGYHFHFISNDKKMSGHVMDLMIENCQIAIEPIYEIRLLFPKSKSFEQAQIEVPTIKTYIDAQF